MAIFVDLISKLLSTIALFIFNIMNAIPDMRTNSDECNSGHIDENIFRS